MSVLFSFQDLTYKNINQKSDYLIELLTRPNNTFTNLYTKTCL